MEIIKYKLISLTQQQILRKFFFESRIVSLAIKHAAVSLEAGGCLDSDPNTNCGLVIGQDTTPKFVATFENGDRANLRNSPNLIVEKNSSSISIESDGPLAKSIRALTAGDYSLTATYTNDFDSTDTLTVTTDTYKVVADSPKYLLIDVIFKVLLLKSLYLHLL